VFALNVRQVEVFRAVIEAGTVTAAAARLNVTQPSVSKHLKLLEAAFGVPLFERTGNRLVPTAEARAFHEQIERTYRGLDHLARFADDLRNNRQGEILLAAMPLIAHSWLPDIIASFLAAHGKVSMSLPVRSSRWIAEWVAAGRVDFGIGLSSGDDSGIQRELLMRTPLVCALPAEHRLTRFSTISPAHLGDETLISLSNFDHWRLAVESVLDGEQVTPCRRVDTFTTYTACDLVTRGVGVAIVDIITALKYAGPAMAWRPFDPDLAFEIFLMRSRHWRVPRLAESLIELIEQEAGRTTDLIRQELALE
jgi:DNA-binding transcriptional LysR family regulator